MGEVVKQKLRFPTGRPQLKLKEGGVWTTVFQNSKKR